MNFAHTPRFLQRLQVICATAFIVGAFQFGARAQSKTVTLKINADQTTGSVSPRLYGLMTEEINFSYDGGLYGELIRNRCFKDNPMRPASWSLVQEGNAQAVMVLD